MGKKIGLLLIVLTLVFSSAFYTVNFQEGEVFSDVTETENLQEAGNSNPENENVDMQDNTVPVGQESVEGNFDGYEGMEGQNTEPVIAEEPTAEPVLVEEPIAEPVIVEEPIAEPVIMEEPTAEPVIVVEPTAEPIFIEEPTAIPVMEEPTAEPVVEEPTAEPLQPVWQGLNEDQVWLLSMLYNEMTPTGQAYSGWFWAENYAPCTWSGISCDGEGHVSGLSFENTGFFTVFPSSILSFRELKELRMVDTLVRGPLPERLFADLPKLEKLELSGNYFTGTIPAIPEYFEVYPVLEQIIIRDNREDDRKSQLIYNPAYTDVMYFSPDPYTYPDLDLTPGLDGSIPWDWNRLPLLSEIDLSGNSLTGEVPQSFSQLPLRSLDLRENDSLTITQELYDYLNSFGNPDIVLDGLVLPVVHEPEPIEEPVQVEPVPENQEQPYENQTDPNQIFLIQVNPNEQQPEEIYQEPTAMPLVEIPTEVPQVIIPAEIPTEVPQVIIPAEIPTEVPQVVIPAEIPTEVPQVIVPAEIPTEVPQVIIPADIPTEVPQVIIPADIPTEVPQVVIPTDIPTQVPQVIIPTEIPTEVPQVIIPTDIPTQVPPTAAPVIPTAVPTQVPPTPQTIIVVVTATPVPQFYTATPASYYPTQQPYYYYPTATPYTYQYQQPYYTYPTATPYTYYNPNWVYPTATSAYPYPQYVQAQPTQVPTMVPTQDQAALLGFTYKLEAMTENNIPMTWRYTGMTDYSINYLDASGNIYPGFAMEWTPAAELCNASACNASVSVPDELLRQGKFALQLRTRDAAGKTYVSDAVEMEVSSAQTAPTPEPEPEQPKSFFAGFFEWLFGPLIRLFRGK